MKSLISSACIILISFVFLLLVAKGQYAAGVLNFQKGYSTSVGSPFELSNSTSRYALTQAIVDNNSFFLTKSQARFAAPDVVLHKGNFLSIFTPGVSFIAVPFYIIGKQIGAPQITTFLMTTIFALINLVLISKLAQKLGGGKWTSIASGLIFTFATNALTYSQTLTQHHISIAIIVFSILLTLKKSSLVRNLLIGILFGLGLLMDIPNAIMLIPVIIWAVFQDLSFRNESGKVSIGIRLNIIAIAIGLLPLIFGFVWYNTKTTGSPSLLAQSVGRTDFFDNNVALQNSVDSPKSEIESPFERKSSIPFNTRKELNGIYTLLLSDERSWLYYSPIVLLGLIGFALSFRRKERQGLIVVLTSIILMDVLIYSSFGDPWGGWAFGSRYLLPATALLVAGLGILLQKFKNNVLMWLIVLPILLYSCAINVLGVMTTSAIPPKVEAINLPQPIPYTYEYNLQLIRNGFNSSLAYNYLLYDKISIPVYLLVYFVGTSSLILGVLFLSILQKEVNNND